MRSIALALVCCGCRPAPDETTVRPAVAERDAAAARLQWVVDAGVPRVLGWMRVRRVVAFDHQGAPRCRNAWVREQGNHRVVLDDELQVDFDGLWFATWPAQMRVAHDAYASVDRPVRQAVAKRMQLPREPLHETQSDLLAEVSAELGGADTCGMSMDEGAVSLLRAGWVHELGHTELAHAIIRRWNLSWSDDGVRSQLAEAMQGFVADARRQGMPRAELRRWLERTAKVCDCVASQHAAEQLAVLGDDPSGPIDANDPNTLIAWLADDLVFPFTHHALEHPRDGTGWGPQWMPRSPALELHALGWSALPALVESQAPAQLMRRQSSLLTTTHDVRRAIASDIALQSFADDEQLRTWWAAAKQRSELASHIAAMTNDDRFVEHRIRRMLALDETTALAAIADVFTSLAPRMRTRVALAVVQQVPHRRWLDRAIAAAQTELDAPHDADTERLVADLVEVVARADPRRGAALLRAVMRREKADEHLAIAEGVLATLCEPEDDEPMPDCRPPLRRMFDAVSSRP